VSPTLLRKLSHVFFQCYFLIVYKLSVGHVCAAVAHWGVAGGGGTSEYEWRRSNSISVRKTSIGVVMVVGGASKVVGAN
jgi:hypothetical protein